MEALQNGLKWMGPNFLPVSGIFLLEFTHFIPLPGNISLGEDVLKTSSRRLQCNIFLSSKTSWRSLQDIIARLLLENALKWTS